MAPLPSLALARLIVRNFYLDDFSLVIIDGNLRVGKSVYAIKALSQALKYIKGKALESMADLKWVMGWEPEQVVESWQAFDERQPGFIWDDAGYWLNSMNWNDPLMISIQKYFNVVATDFNTVILTTPSPKWVLGKIRGMPDMIRCKVTKRDGSHTKDEEYRKFARKAKGYKAWDSPDLKGGGVNTVIEDEFSCKLPQKLYDEYHPIRAEYARKAKLEIVKSINRARLKRELEDMKDLKSMARLKEEVFGKGYEAKQVKEPLL